MLLFKVADKAGSDQADWTIKEIGDIQEKLPLLPPDSGNGTLKTRSHLWKTPGYNNVNQWEKKSLKKMKPLPAGLPGAVFPQVQPSRRLGPLQPKLPGNQASFCAFGRIRLCPNCADFANMLNSRALGWWRLAPVFQKTVVNDRQHRGKSRSECGAPEWFTCEAVEMKLKLQRRPGMFLHYQERGSYRH